MDEPQLSIKFQTDETTNKFFRDRSPSARLNKECTSINSAAVDDELPMARQVAVSIENDCVLRVVR